MQCYTCLCRSLSVVVLLPLWGSFGVFRPGSSEFLWNSKFDFMNYANGSERVVAGGEVVGGGWVYYELLSTIN